MEVILVKISERVTIAGHQATVLPHLHELLVLCSSTFEKVNTESARLSIIKRKLTLPKAELFQDGQELANLVML